MSQPDTPSTEILGVNTRYPGGVKYVVSVRHPKVRGGRDVVDVIMHDNGAISTKSAKMSTITPHYAIRAVKARRGTPSGDPRVSAAKRRSLKPAQFALPARRQLPLHDRAHVRNAAARLEQMRRRGTVTTHEYRTALRRVRAAERRLGIGTGRQRDVDVAKQKEFTRLWMKKGMSPLAAAKRVRDPSSSTLKAVTNGEGKFLGKMSLTGPLGWVGPAHSYGFSEHEATALAKLHGGHVVNAPRWNDAAKRYEVPAGDPRRKRWTIVTARSRLGRWLTSHAEAERIAELWRSHGLKDVRVVEGR